MKKLILPALLSLSFFSKSQLPPKDPYPYDVLQIHSGHSLTDPLFHPWPGQYRYLMSDINDVPFDNLGKSTIPGSPMNWRWNHSSDVSPDARMDISDWELLCITEGVPLSIEKPDMQSWEREGLEGQRTYLSLFVNNAWNNGNNGNGAPTLLWTTWTNINDEDGPWRPLLDTYESEWENMQDYANENRPAGSPPVYLIPGHRMMARLYDDIQNGLVPGIDTISQFFSDNIHVNHLGAYAVAMIHYACIFNENPFGLPANLYYDQDNDLHPSVELALYLQTMTWEVVTGYSERTGISGIITSISKETSETEMILFGPNPVRTTLNIHQNEEKKAVTITNLLGNQLLETYESSIDLRGLPAGIYLIHMGKKVERFQKL